MGKGTAVRIAVNAKAGRRKLPNSRGKHITTLEQRKRGSFLSKFGLKPYQNPWFTKGPATKNSKDD